MITEIVTSVSLTSWVVLIVLLLLAWYMTSRNDQNLPPSPGIALPILGHMYMVKPNPRPQFQQWAAKLGQAFSLRMGSKLLVVFNGYQAVKEALVIQADYFSDRPSDLYVMKKLPWFCDGVVASSGTIWKTQRTTTLSILRRFGMGKNIMAERIGKEVDIFVQKLGEINGKPKDLREMTHASVSNVICAVIFGQRFEDDDPKFLKLIHLLSEISKRLSGINILDFLPFLASLPFDPFMAKALVSINLERFQIVQEIVAEKKQKYDPGNLDNFVVAYIHEMKKNETSKTKLQLDEANLTRVIDNLFAAGTETTSTTMLWCVLYSLYYPQVQQKIYQEIKKEVGTDRLPNVLDKPKLKYLNAVIMETQRIASVIPLNLPHTCSQDTTVCGYHIPKGAQIIPNLDSVLLDPKIWGDPDIFRPERFLDDQGNFVKTEELVPFSLGRRACLGEGLAKTELFLYLSALYQKFQLLPADLNNLPPLEYVWGAACPPKSYEIRCVARKV